MKLFSTTQRQASEMNGDRSSVRVLGWCDLKI